MWLLFDELNELMNVDGMMIDDMDLPVVFLDLQGCQQLTHQGSNVLHHSSTKAKLKHPQGKGGYLSLLPFFVSFLGKQKRKRTKTAKLQAD